MRVDLTARDLLRLQDVHPDLVKIIHKVAADSPLEFFIVEGKRSIEDEKKAVAAGKSQTLDSRHIFGLAVDIAVKVEGALTWDVKYYHQFADAFLATAASLAVPVVWGGSWKTLKDYDHFELNRAYYPNPKPQT
jgi:peptidoglycan L-alanyl-D-glutamate endopeptidase CwlK